MKKVWIFGDSYSDPRHYTSNNFSWTQEIEKNFKVNNFSYYGSGPEWSYELFTKKVKENNTNDISLIFFISDPFRFNFSFYKNVESQALFKFITFKNKRNMNVRLKLRTYESYSKFCKQFFKNYAMQENFLENQIIKTIGGIKIYENIFEKILIWPIFFNVDSDFSSIKTTVIKKSLSSLEKNYDYGEDYRANHLSFENHQTMISQLSNWVNFNTPIDISKFKKN